MRLVALFAPFFPPAGLGTRARVRLALVLALATGGLLPSAQARSELSEASGLSVAVSVLAPVAILSAGARLTVAAVESSAEGTAWVLERASDGARATVRWSGRAAGLASVAVGTVVEVSAMSTGWLLSAAGRVLAFIPNALGASLLHSERITP